MLRKILKYLIILALACAIVFVLFSCKSKKAVAETEQAVGDNKKNTAANQVLFAQMYVDGCAERMKGNLTEALKLFEKCREIDPQNAATRYELATIQRLLGNMQQALENAKFCASKEENNEWYQLLLIDCYQATKQYAQAIKVRETLVKNHPGKSEFKEDLAIDYAISGQYEKSFKIYDELERSYGVNEQLTLNKVKLLKSQKKEKEIEKEFLKLKESNPSEPRYYSYLAEYYAETNNLEKAKLMYDKILAIDPGNPTVHLALHDYYNAIGDNQNAFAHLKKAFANPDLDAKTKSNIAENFYGRAVDTQSEEAKKQGKELCEIILQAQPKSAEANALYADFLMLDKKTAEAARYYYLATRSELKNYQVWERLLEADNLLGKFDSLEKHSSGAIEHFPGQPRNYLYNGLANTHLKNYKKASESLREGMEYVIDNKNLMLDFLRLLGDAYFYTREHDRSDKAFDEALKIDPDNAYVLNNYAYYLSLRGDNLDKAEKLSKRTNELFPDNRNYMDTYGWILYKQKKYCEAETYLKKASKIGNRNPTILEHYGDVLYRLNKREEAVEQWKSAKESGNNSEELNKKIKEKKLND